VLTAQVTGEGASVDEGDVFVDGPGAGSCSAFCRWSASTASRSSRLEGKDLFLSASRSWRLVRNGGAESSATNQTTSHSFRFDTH
jgi:hypothetical protein